MDVHCTTCGEPWDIYLLMNEAIFETSLIIKDSLLLSRSPRRTELVKRLLAERCEICGSTEDIEVHHVRKLADLKKRGRSDLPLWAQIMSARRRKTLVLCTRCHDDLHAGRPLKLAREAK